MFRMLPCRMMHSLKICVIMPFVFAVLGLILTDARADVGNAIKVIKAADGGQVDQAKLSACWQELVDSDDDSCLFQMLVAMNHTGPVASNWIASAIDALVERLKAKDAMYGAEDIEPMITDQCTLDGEAKFLAYEMLADIDPERAAEILPDMLYDNSLPLRRLAVEQLADRGRALVDTSPDEARKLIQKAFDAARDFDQIKQLVADLTPLGVEVDMTRKMGIVRRWKLIAPFDDTDRKGFATAYPPEIENAAGAIDYTVAHQGKEGPIRWFDHTTDPKKGLGRVDLNQIQGKSNSVTGYAATEFISPVEGPAQIRIQSFNALKVWIGGKQAASIDVYHSGSQFDQHVIPIKLVKGKNVILVKLCQNDQPQGWAQQWHFSLRVCDEQGGAILSTDRP